MRSSVVFGSILALSAVALQGCSEPAHSSPLDSKETAAHVETVKAQSPHGGSEAQDLFFAIREQLAQGNISAAAAMTTDPATYSERMAALFERVGQDRATARFANRDDVPIRLTKADGDFAMVIVELSENQYSPVAAKFYQRGVDGKLKEMVDSSPAIPCTLLRTFYAEKGEPDAQVVCAE